MTKNETVGVWLNLIEQRYPAGTAAQWDNSGLQVGDPSWPVARVLVTLDVTSAVLTEAQSVPHTLIVAHHPLLFHPLQRLTPDTAAGKLALHAAGAHIAVTAVHTNLDIAQDGTSTSAPLAKLLALTDLQPLMATLGVSDTVKLVTFVPEDDVTCVRDALTATGAGVIGEYSACSFISPGTGTFRPSANAQPAITSSVDQQAFVAEHRLEMVVPRNRLGAVIVELCRAHPYEKVAYDVYERADQTETFGLIGTLSEPVTLDTLAKRITGDLPAPDLRVAGDRNTFVSRVAVCGGAGDSLIGAALAHGADVYLTGDLRHHVSLDARELGLALIDVGHYASEVAALPAFIDALTADAARHGLATPVLASQVNTSPWS
ncbi:MAG: Nif3-like dinuclear metal center hexameric protein [Nitriliruptoraceae bacterium]